MQSDIWLLISSKDGTIHAATKERIGYHPAGKPKWSRIKFTALCSSRYMHFLDAHKTIWSARLGSWTDVTCEQCRPKEER
jgi:hypothetical protein